MKKFLPIIFLLSACSDDPEPLLPCVKSHQETILQWNVALKMMMPTYYTQCDERADCSKWKEMGPEMARSCLDHVLWQKRNQSKDAKP